MNSTRSASSTVTVPSSARITRAFRSNDDGRSSLEAAEADPSSGTFGQQLTERSRDTVADTCQLFSFETVIEYDEYEEEDEEKRKKEEKAESNRNIFALFEDWTRLQAANVATARAKRRRQRRSPKTQRAPGSRKTVAIGESRGRIVREMQDEIRLEEYEETIREKLAVEEADERETQLRETREVLSRYWTASAENARVVEEEQKWSRYMNCDGLPDPGSLADANTFIYLWSTMESEEARMDTVADTCDVITHLLSKLEKIVRFSSGISEEYVAECEAIAAQFRIKLERWIDLACYRLLRNIEAHMSTEDTKTARYVLTSEKVICCVWAPIALPIGTKRLVEKERKPIQIHFEEIDVTVKLPVDTECYRMAVRALWLSYDHYSIETGSYRMPPLLPGKSLVDIWRDCDSLDLLEFSVRERAVKGGIRDEQAEVRRLQLEEKKAILERVGNPVAAMPTSAEKKGKRGKKGRGLQSAVKLKQQEYQSDPPVETNLLSYLPTPDEIVLRMEEESRKEVRRLLFTRCEKTQVNLRKYRILGGVYRVDLVYQPPQPKDLGSEASLTTLQLPKEARFVPFRKLYAPPQPAPDLERTPEVIEAEMKALEAAMEELALITLKLPDSCFWFEPPLIAHWLPDKRIWSTEDVHDIKYNEEKQTIAFRSGRLGIFGLATYRYANLPFQNWELKPEGGRSGREYGGVTFNVAAATVQVEFIVRDDRVCLNSFVGNSSTPFQQILGRYMELESLIEHMQQVGCDLFPDRDAASYLKGLSTKHPIAERHLRECMAMLSTAYSFAWSRWNATRTFREIVLQFKEIDGCVAKERTNLTLLVTPSRTLRIRCTEVSSEFTDLPLDYQDTKFYADLYQLAINTAGIKSRLLMKRVSFKLVSTVSRLLELTNVISMSS